MQLSVHTVLRDRLVDILKRHGDGLFLARLDHILDLHSVDRKSVFGRQRVLHLQRHRPQGKSIGSGMSIDLLSGGA